MDINKGFNKTHLQEYIFLFMWFNYGFCQEYFLFDKHLCIEELLFYLFLVSSYEIISRFVKIKTFVVFVKISFVYLNTPIWFFCIRSNLL